MQKVDIYSILTIRESHTRCKLPGKYYLECTTDKKLYLCYGDITKENSEYCIELREYGYDKLITEIKKGVDLIEVWNLSDIKKSIDVISELGLSSFPNNNPRLCK